MNKLIKMQLEKVTRLKLPIITDDLTKICISKMDVKIPPKFAVDKYFVISMDSDLLTSEGGLSLAEKWNFNTFPPSKYMLVIVLQILGSMLKIEGVEYDPLTGENKRDPWTGWLPLSQVKIEKELEV